MDPSGLGRSVIDVDFRPVAGESRDRMERAAARPAPQQGHDLRRPLPARLETTVPAHPSHAGRVRRLVGAQLLCWRLGRLRDDVVLATAELFANAVQHAGSSDPHDELLLSLECTGERLRVALSDSSPLLPRGREAGAGAESGRGLSILAALVDDWGTAPAPLGRPGKQVWFTVATKEPA
ncbi:ATP-binding protein [Streptomyces sp. NPDC058045]|uniref:ATP-binding protein n=1 Tax=Streptomyces sp. NPDC058045 TaxID=3346311 RepID=UPI0036EB881F